MCASNPGCPAIIVRACYLSRTRSARSRAIEATRFAGIQSPFGHCARDQSMNLLSTSISYTKLLSIPTTYANILSIRITYTNPISNHIHISFPSTIPPLQTITHKTNKHITPINICFNKFRHGHKFSLGFPDD